MTTLIELKNIEAARAALPAEVRRTPILPFACEFSEIGNERCFLKCENLQVTGAFKVRAAFTMLNALPEDARNKGVVLASSGNFAQGFAYAGRTMDVPITVVMLDHTSVYKVRATKDQGGRNDHSQPRLHGRPGSGHRSGSDYHRRTTRHQVEHHLDIFLQHPDTAGRRFTADGIGIHRPVDSDSGDLLRISKSEPTRTEDIARIARTDRIRAGAEPGRILLANLDAELAHGRCIVPSPVSYTHLTLPTILLV